MTATECTLTLKDEVQTLRELVKKLARRHPSTPERPKLTLVQGGKSADDAE